MSGEAETLTACRFFRLSALFLAGVATVLALRPWADAVNAGVSLAGVGFADAGLASAGLASAGLAGVGLALEAGFAPFAATVVATAIIGLVLLPADGFAAAFDGGTDLPVAFSARESPFGVCDAVALAGAFVATGFDGACALAGDPEDGRADFACAGLGRAPLALAFAVPLALALVDAFEAPAITLADAALADTILLWPLAALASEGFVLVFAAAALGAARPDAADFAIPVAPRTDAVLPPVFFRSLEVFDFAADLADFAELLPMRFIRFSRVNFLIVFLRSIAEGQHGFNAYPQQKSHDA